jgi:hypothetical protein
MNPETLLHVPWLGSLLPDFVLAFAFFTAVSYSTLYDRFKHRSTVVIAVALGLALSLGLIWWERENNLSLLHLGPLALAIFFLVLALALFPALKKAGGLWAGILLTAAVLFLVAQPFQITLPIDPARIFTTMGVILIFGFLLLLIHKSKPFYSPPTLPAVKPDQPSLNRQFRERHLSDQLSRRMSGLKKEARSLIDRPEDVSDIAKQIQQMLPAQGYLTEKMAQLRAKAHQIRHGHIARLEETKQVFQSLPTSAKKKAAGELVLRYNQMIGIDTRLERLDQAVAENEKRIRQLTLLARKQVRQNDHQKLYYTFKSAEKLQKHNSRLFKIIDRTEKKLSALAQQIAQQVNSFSS